MTDEKQQGKPPNLSEVPVASSKRKCRICFEGDGELIAPCLCDGNSKWIHRDCLNKWRASRTNPRALTQCEVCLFQYELDIRRLYDATAEDRRRHFLLQLLLYSVMWFFGIQAILFGLAMLIKLLDPMLFLVKFFGFQSAEVSGYWTSLSHYLPTYYIGAVVFFISVFGLLVTSTFCCGCPVQREQCGVVGEGMELCCQTTVAFCPLSWCNAASLGFDMMLQAFCTISIPAMLVIAGATVLFVVFVIGLLAALATIAVIVQKSVQNYVKWKEMGLIAEEYVVRDLAAPDGGAPPQQDMEGKRGQEGDLSQLEIRQRVEEELQAVFGQDLPAIRTRQGLGVYGSMESSAPGGTGG